MKLALLLTFALGAVLPVQQAQPPIQNGRVETRRPAALDREIAALAAGAAEPIWAGWRVPIVDGERAGCSTWFDRNEFTRGTMLDYGPLGATGSTGRPQLTAPAGPLPIEGGTGLVIMLRLTDRRIERLLTLSDDCPIDAGGRTVYWLDAVSPADSIRLLETLTRTDALERLSINARSNLASSALSAIALHRDPAADAVLDRMVLDRTATSDVDFDRRNRATSLLARLRGAHGFAMVRKLLEAEHAPEARRQLVAALGEVREPGVVDALRPFLKDVDPRIRASAVYAFAVRGGPAVVAEVTKIINDDATESVKTRAVSGLARLPADIAVPALIQLARTTTNPAVRKQAVSSLSQSSDPRALAFLEEILKSGR